MIGRAEVANNSDLNTIQARKEIISILYSLRDYSHFFRLVKTPKKGSQVQNPVHHEQKQKLSGKLGQTLQSSSINSGPYTGSGGGGGSKR